MASKDEQQHRGGFVPVGVSSSTYPARACPLSARRDTSRSSTR